MRRWVFAALLVLVTGYTGVSVAEDTTFDPGRSTRVTIPILKIPFGAIQDPDDAKNKEEVPKLREKDKKEKTEEEIKEEKRQAALDKKVDDAIKKARGEPITEEK